jgi:hypothetical protein
MILTGPLPKISFWKISDKLACGSTEKTRTFFALLGKPIGGRGGEGGLAQPTLAAKHNIASFRMFLKDFSQ